MSEDSIIIKGARQNNLKNIDVVIPRNKLVVITGISGSGKSSLAMDTLYAEGQRRFLESLSSYARQFLGEMDKPDVDSIEGLSPAIAIEQKPLSKNPRSTVGTVTEIYDHYRLLYANVGIPHCPNCGKEIKPQTPQQIIQQILDSIKENQKFIIKAPVIRDRKGEYKELLQDLKKQGYVRVEIDGIQYTLDEEILIEKNVKHTINVIVDRLVMKKDIRARLADSIETALDLTDGLVIVEIVEKGEQVYSEHLACIDCGISFPPLDHKMFSFNIPHGSCKYCSGLGNVMEFDYDLFLGNDLDVPLQETPIRDIPGFGSLNGYSWQTIVQVAKHYGFDTDNTPIKDIDPTKLHKILFGSDNESIDFHFESDNNNYKNHNSEFKSSWQVVRPFEGLIPILHRRYMETRSEWARDVYENFMNRIDCPQCNGKRLKPESLAVTINDLNIADLSNLAVKDSLKFFKNEIKLNETEKTIVKDVLKEILDRLSFLENVGLDYISLNRRSDTLSVGEAERIRIATQLGSSLVGVLYVLDEPSIGLHQRDISRLVSMLKKLRDLGNTVIVVEHDEAIMRNADHIIDLGPLAGERGGEIVAEGTIETIITSNTLTGEYLSGKKRIEIPKNRRKISKDIIEIKGAEENNLKGINVKIPLGVFVCITGVSGAGKTSLIIDCLYKGLHNLINTRSSKVNQGKFDKIIGFEKIDKIINIDQSPIGRTPRSVPATYTKALDYIREIFAGLPESRERGYKKGRFSFNTKAGHCKKCKGTGFILKEMYFLPDVYIKCDLCKGKRYNAETLDIKYRGKSIYNILKMTFHQALEFFDSFPNLKRTIKTVVDVGLGYLELGQSSTTLSGGESQRLKIARELRKTSTGNTLYILDEPTTGLSSFDINYLLKVLQELVDKGNTVIIIEHNMDIIKSVDHIIDLGPEGGEKGGKVVVMGSPEEIINFKGSYTAKYLKKYLNDN